MRSPFSCGSREWGVGSGEWGVGKDSEGAMSTTGFAYAGEMP
ncbi:hypothetical protein [Nostoc sp.]